MKQIYNTLLLLILTGGLLVYTSGAIIESFEHYQKQQEVDDEFESYVEKIESGEISASDEGLKSYFSLTDEEIETFTNQEKTVTATSLATKLNVYELKLDIITDSKGNFKCAGLNEFNYEDEFDQYIVSPKWKNFYDALAIQNNYDYKYLSNVYVKGNDDFRINYKEDEYKTITTESWFVDPAMVKFVDRVQIVLPDKDEDYFPDDIELNYKVSLDEIYINQERQNSQQFNIPLTIKDNEITISAGMRC